MSAGILRSVIICAVVAAIASGAPLRAGAEGRIRDITGSASVILNAGESFDSGRDRALREAKTDALRAAFGEDMQVTDVVNIADGKADVQTHSLSRTSGEWIETTGDPVFELTPIDNGASLRITATVKGKGRQRSPSQVRIKAATLRNGTAKRCADDRFVSGDDLYLGFSSPAEGWLNVYLVDKDNAVCLLPYPGESNGSQKILANTDYIFFSKDTNVTAAGEMVREYTMTCNGDSELNHIYVVYSRSRFDKVTPTVGPDAIGAVTATEFYKWLTERQLEDPDLNATDLPISVYSSSDRLSLQ